MDIIIMKHSRSILAAVVLTACISLPSVPAASGKAKLNKGGNGQDKGYSTLYAGLPVQMAQVSAPVIKDYRISVADFGGTGDGISLNTEAFEKAMTSLAEKGGGHLDVPAGIWLTGPIKFRSGIDLHLELGAIILLTPDKSAFTNPKSSSRMLSGISAEKCSNISITGEGIIDGNGKYWRYVKKQKVSDTEWKQFNDMGGIQHNDGSQWFPFNLKHFDNITDSPEKEEALRAHLININRCSNVLIQGVTVQNSPRFHIVPTRCSNVIIDGVTVRCPWNAQNGDGIDIGNSERVLVTGCTVDVGDDGICMKGGSGQKGLESGPCKDILICGNTVFHAHGGFVVGSDVSGGMDNIVVRNCTFSGTDTGIRFKSAIGRGGRCNNLFISDIVMTDIKDEAVVFSCTYEDVTYNAPKGVETEAQGQVPFAPDFAGIHISGVTCRECGTAVRAKGIDGLGCIHDVSISDCIFFYTKAGIDIDKATADVSLNNVRLVTFDR